MSSISGVSGHNTYVPSSPANQPPKQVDPDHDGDDDAGESKSTQAAEAAKHGGHKVNMKA